MHTHASHRNESSSSSFSEEKEEARIYISGGRKLEGARHQKHAIAAGF